MKISLTDCGKRFNRDWIFRNFSYQFLPGHTYSITGPNGSGKSTLLQVIGGGLVSSEGVIEYASATSASIPSENAFRQLSIAAPYLELVEEMTLLEFLRFHQQFKPFISGAEIGEALNSVGLSAAANKQIRYFSSGMKQRVKLLQALYSDVSCILLDEPCTNLDAQGIIMYQELISTLRRDRLIIVSSNDIQEYGFCEQNISIADYR